MEKIVCPTLHGTICQPSEAFGSRVPGFGAWRRHCRSNKAWRGHCYSIKSLYQWFNTLYKTNKLCKSVKQALHSLLKGGKHNWTSSVQCT